MDYRSFLGVDGLCADTLGGRGVSVAILDSGTPLGFAKSHAKSDSLDKFGHATEVSSILFGGQGVSGICEGAEPIFIKVLSDSGVGTIKSVTEGIYKAIDSDANLINLSLGFARTEKCPKKLERACQKAFDAGKTIICSAGNDGGKVNWPAALSTTISIGASSNSEDKASFSSIGEVDFVAPGVGLKVLDRRGVIKTVSGTSYSAAIATGVAALLYARAKSWGQRKLNTNLVRSELKEFAHDILTPGWDKMSGYGCISANKNNNVVCMKHFQSFFDIICNKVKSFIDLFRQGEENGKV